MVGCTLVVAPPVAPPLVALHGARGRVAEGQVRQALRRIHHLLGLGKEGGVRDRQGKREGGRG